MPPSRTSGYTLIELLVASGVLSVVIALVYLSGPIARFLHPPLETVSVEYL